MSHIMEKIASSATMAYQSSLPTKSLNQPGAPAQACPVSKVILSGMPDLWDYKSPWLPSTMRQDPLLTNQQH